ncbi:hypothetical protein QC764_114790 [Podospora pseudoanserina]|uniref:Uncharacterized protein n=1 Tax=Podospora pseudoanserina TaxID=2609844 RepID=A0ABR0IPE7_9PEZI|nr:hypothetical protein QC764_114790 [Podospora pseudoanserina]
MSPVQYCCCLDASQGAFIHRPYCQGKLQRVRTQSDDPPRLCSLDPTMDLLLSAELEAGPTRTVRRISLAHGSSPNSKANFAICRSRTQILPLVSRVAGPSKIPSATANNERRFCRQTTPDLITTQGSLSDSSRVILSKISQDGSRR